VALNGGLKGDGTVLRLEDLRLAIACGEIGCTLGNTMEMAAQPRAKPSTTPTPVDSGLHTEGLGRQQGVPSAEAKISPVSTRAEFPGTS
jgi:hypothetical protein